MYTANNSSVKDVMLDQIMEHKVMNNVAPAHVGIDGLINTNKAIMEKHEFFQCKQCRWEDNEVVMCPKCSKFNEKWLEINNINGQEEYVIDGGSHWELLGCLIYLFGIIAAFVLLIWSTIS